MRFAFPCCFSKFTFFFRTAKFFFYPHKEIIFRPQWKKIHLKYWNNKEKLRDDHSYLFSPYIHMNH